MTSGTRAAFKIKGRRSSEILNGSLTEEGTRKWKRFPFPLRGTWHVEILSRDKACPASFSHLCSLPSPPFPPQPSSLRAPPASPPPQLPSQSLDLWGYWCLAFLGGARVVAARCSLCGRSGNGWASSGGLGFPQFQMVAAAASLCACACACACVCTHAGVQGDTD